jgi:hypothetical protein
MQALVVACFGTDNVSNCDRQFLGENGKAFGIDAMPFPQTAISTRNSASNKVTALFP